MRLAANWLDTMAPHELLLEVKRQFVEVRGGGGPTWRSRVSLRNISLDQMQDYVDAVRAARAEAPPQQPVNRETRHGVGRMVEVAE